MKKKKEELTALNTKLNPKKAEAEEATGGRAFWWWIGGGALAAVALVAGVWWIGSRAEGTAQPIVGNEQEGTERTEGMKN